MTNKMCTDKRWISHRRLPQYKRELIWNNGEKLYRVYFGKDPISEIKEEKYFFGGSHINPKYDIEMK